MRDSQGDIKAAAVTAREIEDLRSELRELRQAMDRAKSDAANRQAGREGGTESAESVDARLRVIEKQSLLIADHAFAIRNALDEVLPALASTIANGNAP